MVDIDPNNDNIIDMIALEIEKEILLAAEKIIKSHQNESATNQDSCNI